MKYENVMGKVVGAKVFNGEIGMKIERIVSGYNNLNSETIEEYEESLIYPSFIDGDVHCLVNQMRGFINTSISAAAGGITTPFGRFVSSHT